MSISSRSTKAAMYSEIERLRALLDLRETQLAVQEEVTHRLAIKNEELSAALSAAQPPAAQSSDSQPETTPKPFDRGTRNLLMKRLAITCKASVKWVDGQGFQQYKDGGWIAVPTRTVEFVAKGIGQ